ncbi:MAG: hypothetical protein JXB85_13110 [Anaerolineales bacterium]|nr:hypothetical protein [Anaerolineales bacterium]
MSTSALPTCPKCKQTDQVQKVSALYGLNTKEWIETRTVTDHDGQIRSTDEKHQAHTLLGQKLKPPEKPGLPVHPGIWYGLGLGVVLILLSFFCPFLLVPILIAAGIFVAPSLEIPAIAGQPAWVVIAGLGLCLGLLGLAALVSGGVVVKRRFDRSQAGYQEKKVQYERQDLPRWESAMRRWNELYFCLRDETVFVLGEEKLIRIDDMQKYLIDPSYRS